MGDGWHMDFKQTHFDSYSPPDFYVRVSRLLPYWLLYCFAALCDHLRLWKLLRSRWIVLHETWMPLHSLHSSLDLEKLSYNTGWDSRCTRWWDHEEDEDDRGQLESRLGGRIHIPTDCSRASSSTDRSARVRYVREGWLCGPDVPSVLGAEVRNTGHCSMWQERREAELGSSSDAFRHLVNIIRTTIEVIIVVKRFCRCSFVSKGSRRSVPVLWILQRYKEVNYGICLTEWVHSW